VTTIICGVDAASDFLDARIGRAGAELRVARDAEGIGALLGFCREHKVDLVVMEASGGVEQLPFLLLWQGGIACAIANPFSVRRFAEAMGLLEKTDRIDAGVIAWYAEAKRLVAQEPPSADQARLTALVRRLGQLTTAKVAQSNQRRLQTDPDVLASIDEVTALLSRQIRSFEAKIAELLEADPLWRAFDDCFRSIKGIADRTVARLMADLPEIGTLSNKAVAKLAGLAPIARDSGKVKGRRHLRGGRASIRGILFVVAEIVRRHNPHFADMHRRLSEAGKPKKLIRVAIARKLLVQLNAKARDVRRQLATAP
jgi:transposase